MNELVLQPNEGLIRREADRAVWALVVDNGFDCAEILDIGRSLAGARAAGTGRIVLTGGIVTPGSEPDSIAAAFARWAPHGKAELENRLRAWERACAQAGIELLIWPRAGTLVSDIPGLLNIARKMETVGVVLDPEALLPSGFAMGRDDLNTRLQQVLELGAVRAVVRGVEASPSAAELQERARALGKPLIRVGV